MLKAVAELVIPLLEVKQVGRFFSSDVGDGEGVLTNLIIFLECSDSYYYIDKEIGKFFNMYLTSSS